MSHVHCTEKYTSPGEFIECSRALMWATLPGLVPSSAMESWQRSGEILCPSEQNGDDDHPYLGDVRWDLGNSCLEGLGNARMKGTGHHLNP